MALKLGCGIMDEKETDTGVAVKAGTETNAEPGGPQKPRPVPKVNPRMDGDWFRQRLAKVGRTQNGLANHMNLPGSQLSRLFNGTRSMKLTEAPVIAKFLAVSVEEVLEHAGLPPQEANDQQMQAEYLVGADSKLILAKEPFSLPRRLAARVRDTIPYDYQGTVHTALIRAPKGALSIWDDNLVLYGDLDNHPPEMGVLSIAKLRDGVVMMGKIVNFRKTGEAQIKTADDEIKSVQIDSAAKVLAVIQ